MIKNKFVKEGKKKEETLSDKIFWIETNKRKGGKHNWKGKKDFEGSESYLTNKRLRVKDVKTFIKKLKEELDRRLFFDDGSKQCCDYIIDELAGEKLK